MGVDGGEDVVENENFGLAGDGAGDGGALALTAGEGDTAFAEEGLELVGEALDVLVEVGGLGGPCDAIRVGLGEAECEVVFEGAGEEDGFL